MASRTWLAFLLLLALQQANAQATGGSGLPWFLAGQGIPPGTPQNPTPVLLDIIVDNIRSINSHENSWTGVHWLHMSWVDPRAAPVIDASTERWLTAFNSTDPTADAGCARPCDSSGHPTGGCCSNIFIPQIELTNLVYINQESVYRYRIWVDPADPTRMHWSARVSATWHSPFDFRAWPFEHQHLLVEAMVSPAIADRIYLVMGHATFLQNTPHTKGDAVPGWHVAKITRRVYKNNACFNTTNATSTVLTLSDNLTAVSLNPLSPSSWAAMSAQQVTSLGLASTTANAATCVVDRTGFYPEAMALYGPQQLVMDVMMKRTQAYYVLSSVVPLLILDYMVFITYAMERSDLEARMGVVVTLVLSVSALQFTYDFPPASYLNAVQQITLTSYVLFFIVALESMIAAHICRLHARKRAHAMLVSVAHGHPAHMSGHLPRPMQQSFDVPSTPATTRVGSTGLVPPTPAARTFNQQASTAGDAHVVVNASYPSNTTPKANDYKQLSVEVDPAPSQSYPVHRSMVEGGYDPNYGRSRGPRGVGGVGGRTGPGPIAEALTTPFDNHADEPQLRHRARAPASPTNAGKKGNGFCCFSDPEEQPAQQSDHGYVSDPRAIQTKRKGTALSRALTRTVSRVTNAPQKVSKKIDADEAFAQLFAARLDLWFSWSLMLSFTVVVSVLLYINTQVGDHKMMMMGDPPANM